MRHHTKQRSDSSTVPAAWRKAEHAALRANAKDTCDDRVSDDIFDMDDERSIVDILAHGKIHEAN